MKSDEEQNHLKVINCKTKTILRVLRAVKHKTLIY